MLKVAATRLSRNGYEIFAARVDRCHSTGSPYTQIAVESRDAGHQERRSAKIKGRSNYVLKKDFSPYSANRNDSTGSDAGSDPPAAPQNLDVAKEPNCPCGQRGADCGVHHPLGGLPQIGF
jgi:hypothetical protein